jgi:hypothetical protein
MKSVLCTMREPPMLCQDCVCMCVEQLSSWATCIAGASPLPWIQGSHPLLVSVLIVIVTKCLSWLHSIPAQIVISCYGLPKHRSKAFVQPAMMSADTRHNDGHVCQATNCILGIAAWSLAWDCKLQLHVWTMQWLSLPSAGQFLNPMETTCEWDGPWCRLLSVLIR